MENNKKGDLIKNVQILLEASPDTRDNDGELSLTYQYHFWHGTPEEFIMERMPSKIERTRRELQQNNPKLRGRSYEARQAHAKVIRAEKSRNIGQIEDLSSMFPPLKNPYGKSLVDTIQEAKNNPQRFKKEGFFASLFRKLF